VAVNRVRREQIDTDVLDLGDRRMARPQRVAVSNDGMISSAHYCATEAGAEVLGMGGNAFDAAAATAFALGVCEPAASGLGGQTMMLIHHAETRRTFALDGSSRAPNRASSEDLSPSDRRRGYKSSTVPSTPAVLRYIVEQYGKLKLRDVLGPAIRLAEEGYAVSLLQHALTRREGKSLRQNTAARFFLRDGTRPYPIGSIFRQPVLAETLKRLAAKGVKDLYHGQIARSIHRDMQAGGGLIHRDDLAQDPRPIERRPVTCRFGPLRVLTFPPPGAGRTLVEMLNVYEALPLAHRNIDTPNGSLVLAEVIRRAFLDRQDRPFDPSYFPQVSGEKMVRPEHAKRVARQVVRRVRSHGETTHASVMDRNGNVVALTQSIERVYGSCCAAEDLGFLYNDYMSAFEYKDISHPYYLRPNAAPWASVAPTIVFRGRRPWMAIGSPGSERITPSILQVLLRLQYLTPLAAVDAADIPRVLEEHGYEVDIRDPYSFYLGCVQLVLREKGEFIGVADPRRDGSASGPAH
jgi:gamma-glutamyltranspeptidase/glutathione hydrolase